MNFGHRNPFLGTWCCVYNIASFFHQSSLKHYNRHVPANKARRSTIRWALGCENSRPRGQKIEFTQPTAYFLVGYICFETMHYAIRILGTIHISRLRNFRIFEPPPTCHLNARDSVTITKVPGFKSGQVRVRWRSSIHSSFQ